MLLLCKLNCVHLPNTSILCLNVFDLHSTRRKKKKSYYSLSSLCLCVVVLTMYLSPEASAYRWECSYQTERLLSRYPKRQEPKEEEERKSSSVTEDTVPIASLSLFMSLLPPVASLSSLLPSLFSPLSSLPHSSLLSLLSLFSPLLPVYVQDPIYQIRSTSQSVSESVADECHCIQYL